MNKPYVKEQDSNGSITNPIIGRLTTAFPNRRARKQFVKSQTQQQKPGKMIIANLGQGSFLKYITLSQFIPGGLSKNGEFLKPRTIVRVQQA